MNEMKRRRALIYTGGSLGAWALNPLQADDYKIGADRGAMFLIEKGWIPDLAVGDFDSVTSEQMKIISATALEVLTCDAIDKDWSDTEFALQEAISRGFQHIVLLGALGTRFDHSLSNVHLLKTAFDQGCSLTLQSEHHEIRLCTSSIELEANPLFPYTSLLPLTLEVIGITLHGFRYPLYKATLQLGSSLAISNVLDAPRGTIEIADGMLLVIRSRD